MRDLAMSPEADLRALRQIGLPPRQAPPLLTDRLRPAGQARVAGGVLIGAAGLSGLAHAAAGLWLALATPNPPDGPDVAASEVTILSGAQYAAMVAPAPAPPMDVPVAAAAPQSDGLPEAPRAEAAPAAAAAIAVPARPDVDAAPDVAGLQLPDMPAPMSAPPPPMTPMLPEVVAVPPRPDAPVPGRVAAPVKLPPATADAAPSAADPPPAAPAEPPPKPAAKPAAGAARAQKAGDGGTAEQSSARAAAKPGAEAQWLGKIRAQVERRKAYPPAAGGAKGRVTLQLRVDARGRLVGVAVLRSSGNAVLDAAALRAVRAAGRFPPAPAGVAATGMTLNLPLRYAGP